MKYIVLLRGINVGGRNIKMTELKTCFEENGCKGVQTVLQTGNVIMDYEKTSVAALKAKIDSFLSAYFHYKAQVLIVLPNQLQKLIQAFPFNNMGIEYHRYIYFVEKGKVQELMSGFTWNGEQMEAIEVGESIVYWSVLKGNTLDSALGRYMTKSSSKYLLTNRNVNTLEKVLAKC